MLYARYDADGPCTTNPAYAVVKRYGKNTSNLGTSTRYPHGWSSYPGLFCSVTYATAITTQSTYLFAASAKRSAASALVITSVRKRAWCVQLEPHRTHYNEAGEPVRVVRKAENAQGLVQVDRVFWRPQLVHVARRNKHRPGLDIGGAVDVGRH